MSTRQPRQNLELALEGAAVFLDLGNFIFPCNLSGFQGSQGEVEKYSDLELM